MPIGTIDPIGTALDVQDQAREAPELSALKALSAPETGTEQAALAEQTLPVADADDLAERAAIIETGAGVPRRWAEGYTALSTMPAPHGFSPERWQRIVDAAGVFIDRWAAEAIHCGWTDLDIFGCNPDRPDARFDCMGLVLLLDRCAVVGLDADGADLVAATGARQRYRRRPLPADTISLWHLAHRERAR